MLESDKLFGTSSPLRWYFLTRSVDVMAVKIWDKTAREYR